MSNCGRGRTNSDYLHDETVLNHRQPQNSPQCNFSFFPSQSPPVVRCRLWIEVHKPGSSKNGSGCSVKISTSCISPRPAQSWHFFTADTEHCPLLPAARRIWGTCRRRRSPPSKANHYVGLYHRLSLNRLSVPRASQQQDLAMNDDQNAKPINIDP